MIIGLIVASALLAILNRRVWRRIDAHDPTEPALVIDLTERVQNRGITPPPWREIAELDTESWSLPPQRPQLSVLPGDKPADADASETDRPPLKAVDDDPHPYDEFISLMDWVEARETKP